VSTSRFLAFDLGAESGRAVLGLLRDDRLALEELHRFPNVVVRRGESLAWNIPGLFDGIKHGMALAAARDTAPLSLGLDTWGVDFGLVARDGALLDLPRTYRDPRTQGALESFLGRIPREEVYRRTGVQFLPFNSLFQLHAMRAANDPLLARADGILFVPDLFHHLLTGKRTSEFTFATTTQLYNPREGDWDDALLEALGLPRRLFAEIVGPGTALGPVREEVRRETGLATRVIAVATHDTASAVAAVPAEDEGFAYISSGTWSLVGAEVAEPVITADALRFNFTNEGGVARTFRLLKNVMGLWLVQGCRRAWGLEGTGAYARLTDAAKAADAWRSLVDPDDPSFFNPPDMPEAIRRFCRATGQTEPESEAATVRAALDSLALKYRLVLEQLEALRGRPATVVHVVGGGARNGLLCQLTADAAGVPVIAGPAEATAIGNLLVQALAAGALDSLAAARSVVRASFAPERYEPRGGREVRAALARFRELCAARPGAEKETA